MKKIMTMMAMCILMVFVSGCEQFRGMKGDKGDPGPPGKQGEPGITVQGEPGEGKMYKYEWTTTAAGTWTQPLPIDITTNDMVSVYVCIANDTTNSYFELGYPETSDGILYERWSIINFEKNEVKLYNLQAGDRYLIIVLKK